MDPVSVIGVAGTVLSIVGKIANTIILLRGLQSKYYGASLTVSLVISQLSTVRAALNQISNWMNSDPNMPKHHQLVDDLTDALEGCLLLVVVLDNRLSELSRDDVSHKLTSMGKIGVIWEESEMKDYLNHLDHQINALNLLLTAVQCRSTFEQKDILSSHESRHIMSQLKEDTSSLFVSGGGDTDSFRTDRSVSTRSSIIVDAISDFDREIFKSKAYRHALRSNQNLKRHRTPRSFHQKSVGDSFRSIAEYHYEDDIHESIKYVDTTAVLPLTGHSLTTVESQLRVSAIGLEQLASKILIIGASNSGKSTLAKSMDILWSGGKQLGLHLAFPLSQWTEAILLNLYFNVDAIMDAMAESGQKLTSLGEQETKMLRIGPWSRLDGNPERIRAVEKLWREVKEQFAYWELCNSGLLLENSAYLFDSLQRISGKQYTPSTLDILWTSEKTIGINITTFEMKGKAYQVCDVGGTPFEREHKWIHGFKDVSILVFTVDIAGYHKLIAEDPELPPTNCMSDSLTLFESLSSSKLASKACIILLFTKLDQFELALSRAPLSNRFPEYFGGPDIEAAKAFITEKFVTLVPKVWPPIYVGFTGIAKDPTSMAKVVSAGIHHYTEFSTGKNDDRTCDYFVLGKDGSFIDPVDLRSQKT